MATYTQNTVRSMLQKGQDPKELLIEACKPGCVALYAKLRRCEATLKKAGDADPQLTCMYPARDWIQCIEACVQPKIHQELAGNQVGPYT